MSKKIKTLIFFAVIFLIAVFVWPTPVFHNNSEFTNVISSLPRDLINSVNTSNEHDGYRIIDFSQEEDYISNEAGQIEVAGASDNKADESYLVSRVIDGDTIELASGERVRYIGVNTPEITKGKNECFGREAFQKNQELVAGQSVRLEKDVSETDQYGRWLRYVWVNDVMINEYLVASGYAQVATYPPDVKYQSVFLAAQQTARENKQGLWGEVCDNYQKIINNQEASNANCVIKGNISSSGEKIYHLPGCDYYEQTYIDESKGEQWFCTEAEARQAGWRKAKNCP